MSNRSVWTEPRSGLGRRLLAIAPGRVWLLAALVAGKGLDTVSTVVVLGLRNDVYESQRLPRRLMQELGVIEGSLATMVLAVVGVAILAEAGQLVAHVAPDSWTPDGYPIAFRTTTYCVAAAWYGIIGVQNLLLLA